MRWKTVDGITAYHLDSGEWVVSLEGGMWLPGVFTSEEAAREWAKRPHQELHDAWEKACPTPMDGPPL